ncbi:hypothetical protein DDB_G0272434 [Dictyostelium discoideum AX4]|uniref:EGF-like domain-containing protein n=1 Tax=Dictyostelium discoideum TaxID=44689 RepID=Q559U0_DICDI|nr:hypothetical protein DDB_G0272434 [Dictyostelium discoideum AX4]EAL71369.1 hypothetical protein DDB_G0272434 [Dictyostelium discoideum AX4]|eukprot:XP_645244.1 hypothetical protein DDB_G0272434 [Dictyostelium discoideum AX4]
MKLNLISNLLLVFIFLNSLTSFSFGQICPSGYTWNPCITSSGVNNVYLGYTAAPNCPAGATLKAWNYHNIKNNQVNSVDCQMARVITDMSVFRSVGGSCGDGATTSPWSNQNDTLDNTNRYFVSFKCDVPLYPNTVFEVNSSPSVSQAGRASCESSPGAKVGVVSVWDYGQSVCQNGYTNFPVCSTDIDECTTGTHKCVSPATCANTQGSYNCNCPAGYTKSTDGLSCIDIDECATSNGGCAQICTNTFGSSTCSCDTGYTLNSDKKGCTGKYLTLIFFEIISYIDVDECATGAQKCVSPATCANTQGGYNCNCPAGYIKSTDGLSCIDVDECLVNKGGCSQICTNNPGGFECSCQSGYSKNGASCLDIDECSLNTHKCNGSSLAVCDNSIGSYNCKCPSGFINPPQDRFSCQDQNECLDGSNKCNSPSICENSIGSYSCKCPTGYIKSSNDDFSCDDVNECLDGKNGGCQHNCTNSIGGFSCSCMPGYSLNGFSCDDINECQDGKNGGCQQNCKNSIGSFECSCDPGYISNGFSCQDINECQTGDNKCVGEYTSCQNTNGSYLCVCPSNGYSNNGTYCEDIDECLDGNNGGCSQICKNSIGSFDCSCQPGYNVNGFSCDDINECQTGDNKCVGEFTSCQNTAGSYLCVCPSNGFSNNGTYCEDIDECLDGKNGGCQQNCKNSIGSFECSCDPGYNLNGLSCDDINECETQDNKCFGEFTSCQNTVGSYLCVCPSIDGFSNNGTYCEDIDECSSKELNECGLNTVCENRNGSYICQCSPSDYSHSSQFTCEPKPIITNFYQKPSRSNVFIVEGLHFVEFATTITIGEEMMVCQYLNGNDTYAECSTREGKEVIGKVLVEANDILSEPFNFSGAPFVIEYLNSPSTIGGLITIKGRNFPTLGSVQLIINSVDCPISQPLSSDQIICTIGEGSGSFNYIRLLNESVTNTDLMYLTYANPIISSASKVYASGGILTVSGSNFGIGSKSMATLNIGNKHCSNVEIKSHSELTCELESTSKVYTNIIDLVVDGLPVANDYYFTYSTLESGSCPGDCNSDSGKGICTSFGCKCADGFTGISCNETSGGIIPKFPPTNPETPSIDVDNNGDNDGFGYKITIVRIEELDFNNAIIEETSFPLSNAKWNGSSNAPNQWIFNITLENKSYLEATFEYFEKSRNITFASSSFIIPAESLKLSFKTMKWPFRSKLSSLRVVVQTDTIVKNEDVEKCSISNSVTTTYNQHLWSTTENSESGMVARFVSLAELDSTTPITANIEDLSYSSNKKTSIIGISVPYFSKQSIIDPDFGMLLNVENKKTGDCESDDKANWKLATGLSIGAGATVCLAGLASFLYRKKKKEKKFLDGLSKR